MNNKRISFMDSDKRIADLMIRLKHDGLTKTKFFRAILTAYLERNENIINFIEEYKSASNSQSASRSAVVRKAQKDGNAIKKKFGLDTSEIEDIFDILEKEHPDL